VHHGGEIFMKEGRLLPISPIMQGWPPPAGKSSMDRKRFVHLRGNEQTAGRHFVKNQEILHHLAYLWLIHPGRFNAVHRAASLLDGAWLK